MKNKKYLNTRVNVALLSFPYPSPARLVLVENLISILAQLCNKIFIITFIDENNMIKLQKYPKLIIINIGKRIERLDTYSFKSIIIWILRYISIQMLIFVYTIKVLRYIDVAFFFVGIRDFIPLMIFMKLFGQKVVWY